MLAGGRAARARAVPGSRRAQGAPSNSARLRAVVVRASGNTPSHYDVLGVDVDASEEEIRAAYRRRAKELHPDVSKQAGAEEAFKAAKLAHDTLTDADARSEYDQVHRTRRLNFFQDVPDEEDAEGRWPRASPWEVHRRLWEEEEAAAAASSSGRDGAGEAAEPSPEEMLERLSRVMGGGWGGSSGGLREWASGRMDPFGSSSSEAWHRRVEEQARGPGFRRGQALGGSRDDDAGGWGRQREWDPFRPGDGDDPFERRTGWSNPARPEWQSPRRAWEEDEDRSSSRGGSGSGGRPIPGGGDGFRGKPL